MRQSSEAHDCISSFDIGAPLGCRARLPSLVRLNGRSVAMSSCFGADIGVESSSSDTVGLNRTFMNGVNSVDMLGNTCDAPAKK